MDSSTDSSSPKRRPVKQLSAKLGKNIKRQFRRISNHFHHDHVTTLTSPSFPVFAPTKEHKAIRKESPVSSLRSSDSSTIPSDQMSQHSSLAQFPTIPPGTDAKSSHDDLPKAQASVTSPIPGLADNPSSAERSEAEASSAHSVYIAPDALDPFLVDDEESVSFDENSPAPNASQLTLSPGSQSNLSLSPTTPQLPSPNFNKDVPPPPTSESDESQAPDLYLSGLIVPSMFLPIPNTDPLSTLLTKYIYPPEERPVRDLTGDWQQSDFQTLVMTNSWRALAKMARDQLVTTDPEDLALILGLWYIRLACLARLRLFNQTSAECTNLFVVLNGVEPLEARTWLFERILPFELEVMQARVKYWAGDHMGYLDALNALLKKCRTKARQGTLDPPMWKERGARVCLIIASQLVEMKEFRAAIKLLEPLCQQGETSTAALRSSIGRIYLQSGEMKTAAQHFEIVAEDPVASQEIKDMNASLFASAEGDWARASSLLQLVIQNNAENFVAVNNLSVALLSQGKLKESIGVLETALKSSPSNVVIAEPVLFNLSTLYELRSSTAAESKRNLLIEVAKWGGDGLRVACLKMPTN